MYSAVNNYKNNINTVIIVYYEGTEAFFYSTFGLFHGRTSV